MRRIVGYVLLGLGVGLLVLGIAVRVAVYPALAVVPATYPSSSDVAKKTDPPAGTQVSQGKDMKVFVARKDGAQAITEVRTADVTSTRTTASVPGASVGHDLFWKSQLDTSVPDLGGDPISTSWEGVCFDRVSAQAAQGCAQAGYRAENGVVTPVKRDGLFFKFPFDTQQTTYRFWDGVAGQSFAAVYVGSEQIQGLGVYKFVQRIDKVTIPQHLAGGQVSQTVDVPGKFFGLPPSSPAVKATDTYSNTRTLWVEPQTGSIIKGTEDLNRVFVYNGIEVPELVGQIGYTDQTVSAGVALAKDSATGLYLVRVLLPAVLIGLGVLLAIAGSVLVFVLRPSTRGGRRSAGVPPGQGAPSSGVIDLTALDREHADGVS
jgi:hypothetical protein